MPDFIVIPTVLIKDKNLQPLDREVYGIVYWASKMRNERCTMSNQTIANLLNATPSSISHALSRLSSGRYVYVDLDPTTNQRKEIVPLVYFKQSIYPSSDEQGPSANEPGGPSSNELHNNNKNKKEEVEEERDESNKEKLTSKNSIVPLSDLERWEMAKELDVPLWVIQECDKQFWDYIEDPKNRKKYKTSYKTIHKWVRRKLSLGEYQNCNEVEKLQLEYLHPAMQEKVKWAREQAVKRGDV